MRFIKRIWNDPVWSKVISAIIIAGLGVVYSLIRGWISDSETILVSLKKVFSYKANIWFVIGCLLIVMTIIGIIKKNLRKKDKIPQPPFVNDFTRWRYQNQIWTWRWKWSPTYHFYYITDLNIECPNCHDGLLTLEYSVYRCAKCNAEIPYALLNTNSNTVVKQILEDTRKNYNYCAEYIGKLPEGVLR